MRSQCLTFPFFTRKDVSKMFRGIYVLAVCYIIPLETVAFEFIPGSVGTESVNVASFCKFYGNFTYSCQKDCSGRGFDDYIQEPFSWDRHLTYRALQCSTDVPTFGQEWNFRQGIIATSEFRPDFKHDEIVATCVFRMQKSYSCDGVQGCRGNICGSVRPWGGMYDGSPAEGFTLQNRPWSDSEVVPTTIQTIATDADPDTVAPETLDYTPKAPSYFCTFYRNFSYSCKTDCPRSRDHISKPYPSDSQMKYTDMDCSTDIPTSGQKWSFSNGLIRFFTYTSAIQKPTDVVATCSFDEKSSSAGGSVSLGISTTYADKSRFSCNGVSNCRYSPGMWGGPGSCHGGSPWFGEFQGSPQTGITGTIVAEAME